MLAATMLGVAAILGPRADPQAHWTTTPIEHVQTAAVAHHELAAVQAAAGRSPRSPGPRRGRLVRWWFARRPRR